MRNITLNQIELIEQSLVCLLYVFTSYIIVWFIFQRIYSGIKMENYINSGNTKNT